MGEADILYTASWHSRITWEVRQMEYFSERLWAFFYTSSPILVSRAEFTRIPDYEHFNHLVAIDLVKLLLDEEFISLYASYQIRNFRCVGFVEHLVTFQKEV